MKIKTWIKYEVSPITVCGNNHANVATVECSKIVYKAITDGKYKIIHK